MKLTLDILLYTFFVLTAIQILYYLLLFTKNLGKTSSTKRYHGGVSVIICARNAMALLEKNLSQILEQNYSEFEVVVVNDGSTDGSVEFLEALEKVEKKLKVVYLDIDDKYHRGKKFALTMGIKASKYDVLVMTDADCVPTSKNWLQKMVAPFSNPSTEIVLGLGHYEQRQKPLNWAIQLETFHTALFYTSMAKAGIPYMGVGRNLAYRKELFFQHKGFASHQHILGGDDDLFINEAATPTNTAICIDAEAITVSEAHRTFGGWSKQKLRHVSTAEYYKPKPRWLLAMYSLSQFGFYTLFVLLMLSVHQWKVVLAVFGIRFLIQAVVLPMNMLRLNYKPYLYYFPFYDLFIMLIHFYLGLISSFSRSKPKTWN
jgi:cellulose synthase/poly-beta-1,6-N-acetylglucosamine synthase-like glycosyltransferase